MAGSVARTIISIGGNALIRRGSAGEIEEQFSEAARVSGSLSRVVSGGGPVIITHGNGPIVGNIVIRNEAAKDIVPPMPLYICDADSEGGVGFMIQQTIHNELRRAGSTRDVVALVTQVVVDPGDPAFMEPSKPVGPYYTEEEARRISQKTGWVIRDDAGRGLRRVVPSPRPVRIVEAPVVRRLSEEGVVVIAAGGGGVPVVEGPGGALTGVDAVIDKDYATSLLAREAGSELFINLTQVDMVYRGYGAPDAEGLGELTVREAKELLDAGEFAPGSMAPKIEAAMEFLEAGGREVIITTPELLEEALKGRAGTRILP